VLLNIGVSQHLVKVHTLPDTHRNCRYITYDIKAYVRYNRGMSSSLSDILSKRESAEPPEITAIKQFVLEKFGKTPGVRLTGNAIMIIVSSAAFAGALRPRLLELQEYAKTDKRLIIRINSR
jgi:hypothetical protein